MKWFKRKPVTARDTGEAKLPGLGSVPSTGNPQLEAWLRKAAERLEVREGERGNPWERAVTVREFAEMVGAVEKIVPAFEAIAGKGIDGGPISGEATEMIKRFEDSIRNLKVFKDLMKRLDDPSRFDDLPGEIREILLRDLAKEAAIRGAAITRVEKTIQDVNRSLSYEVKTITAAVQRSQAGIREVSFAWADANRAQAGQITQLVASLGNYYQDGTPGRALLETQLGVTADRVQGLSSQITMKVQAGGALAGWGLAATENTAGAQTSAFIVSADKFAVVLPTYSPPYRPVYERDADGNVVYKDGQPVVAYNQILAEEINPAQGGIPFGVDAYGVHLNSNVYVKGSMRVDAGGKTLIQGLRGSVMVLQQTGTWSDTTARNLVWVKIGNAGSAPNNNHLVIGDQATIGTVTRYWNGLAWATQGVVIRGDLLVDGSVAASKVDTYGLTIRNSLGQAVFTSGVSASIPNWFVGGLGALATRDSVNLGKETDGWSDLKVDGQNLYLESFINKWRKASKDNLVTFMEYGAIQEAFIGTAEIGTLTIRGNAVTSMHHGLWSGISSVGGSGAYATMAQVPMTMPSGSSGVFVQGWIYVSATSGNADVLLRISTSSSVSGTVASVAQGTQSGWVSTISIGWFDPNPGSKTYYLIAQSTGPANNAFTVHGAFVTAIGGKR